MARLNDTQTILLSTASQREDGSLYPLPDTVAAGGARVAKAIATLVDRAYAVEYETHDRAAMYRTDGDVGYGLRITTEGLAAIGIEPTEGEGVETASEAPTPAAPRQTKAALVLALLQRDEGATLAELIAATDWLPHTTRAALTGLRKKGHDIIRRKRDETTCYHLASAT